MLYHAAAQRREKRQRRARINDMAAAFHGGDFAKQVLTTLRD